MILTVVTTYDKVTKLYGDSLFTFVSPNMVFGQLRRGVRDEFIKGNVTHDWLKDHDYIVIGEFDTEDGKFDSYDRNTQKRFSCAHMVADLVGDDVEY